MTAGRSRILILRSCRLAQFLAAVVAARQRSPRAEIVALAHRGHRQVLRAAGIDRVIEVRGRRFGLLAMSPWTLAQVRAEKFDEVIIPQMSGDAEAHVNLYRLVMALNPPRVVIQPGEGPAQEFDRARFLAFVMKHTTSGVRKWDAAMFVVLAMGLCERYFGARFR
jgi:hypothetical protein